MRLRGRATSKSLHGSLRRKKGWYLATGGLRLDDGTEIAIAELTQGAVVAGGRFVRLPNGDYVAIEERVRRVMDAIASNRFCVEEPGLFRWMFDAILDQGDRYFHLADLASYLEASERAERDYLHTPEWARKAILNTARTGKFSSDRTIAEYAREIWKIAPSAKAVVSS